jgi:hypothetical protein
MHLWYALQLRAIDVLPLTYRRTHPVLHSTSSTEARDAPRDSSHADSTHACSAVQQTEFTPSGCIDREMKMGPLSGTTCSQMLQEKEKKKG